MQSILIFIIIVVSFYQYYRNQNIKSMFMSGSVVAGSILTYVLPDINILLITTLLTICVLRSKRIMNKIRTSMCSESETDYRSVNYAGVITVFTFIVTIMAFMMADGVGAPVEAILGSTPAEIQQRSMMDKLGRNPGAILIGMIAVYTVSYMLMRFLTDGFRETGIFKLPKKEKCYLY